MSAISLKSITGITSITTPAGVDDQLTLHTNDTTERVKIDVAGNFHINNQLAVAGVTTFASNVNLGDNDKVIMGTDSDLQLFHDGSNAVLQNNTGTTFIIDDRVDFQSSPGAARNLSVDGLNVRLPRDNAILSLGASDDLKLIHNGTDTFIDNNKGDFYLQTTSSGDDIILQSKDDVEIQVNGGASAIYAEGGGSVYVKWNNNNRIITTSAGVSITNDLDVDGHTNLDNVNIVGITTIGQGNFAYTPHNTSWATSSAINLVGNYGGGISFNDNGNGGFVQYLDGNGSNFYIKSGAIGGATATSIKCIRGGAVELHHNGNLKLATFSGGISVTGQVNSDGSHMGDNDKALFGNSNDLQIFHDGSFNKIIGSSAGNHLILRPNSADEGIRILNNAAVELYFDGVKKFETTSEGINVSGITTSNTGFMFGTDGEMYLYKSAANTATLRITSDGPYAQFKDVSGDVQMGSDSGTLLLSAGGNEKVRITSSGDFGTGGVTPTTQSGRVFHLHAGAAQQRLHMTNNTTGTSATDGFEIIVEQSANTRIRNFEAGDMAFDTGGTNNEVMRLKSNGDVAIGSQSPAARLDVFKAYNGLGAGNAAARIYGTDAGVAETGIRFVEKGTGDLHNQPDAYLMRGISNNVNKFVFLANGKVLIGSTNHNSTIGSGVGSQLQVEGNTYQTSSLALINNSTSTDPAFINFGKSRAGTAGGVTRVNNGDRLGGIRFSGADGNDLHSRAAQIEVYVDGDPGVDDMPGRISLETTPDGLNYPTNHLILYGTTKEVRNAGHYVAQTSGSGLSSQTASFGATQSGMSASSYNYILSGSNDGGNKCVLFVNGSNRSNDGGTNALTLRNDGGNLNLGNSGTSTYIKGTTYISQSIGNQQTVFRYDNNGGVGAYLSLQNRHSTANTAVGIAFGCDNSDASMTSSDYGNGQIKVTNDGSDGGIMGFHVHTGANFEAMKIVGNLHNTRNATNGNTLAMKGGVAFSVAGIAIDKSWDNYPGLHVFNETGHSDTNQGQFRFHGWNTSYNSYPQSSGSDFSVNLICDGSGLTSDERRKTGISTITNALNTVSQLRGVKYTQVNRELKPQTHMTMDNGQKLGFIAQEVIPHLPSIVIDSGDHVQPMENGYCDRYMIDYGSVVALLTEAVKELKSKNEALEARIATLESS